MPGVGPISEVTLFIRSDAPEGIYDIRFEDEDTTSYDNQLSDSLGYNLIIPVLVDGYVNVINTTDIDTKTALPGIFELYQNYPNPFNAGTMISFSMDEPGEVDLAVYDILGRKVASLYSGHVDAGITEISWNGRSSTGNVLASGVYYYRLTSKDGNSFTRRMTLLK